MVARRPRSARGSRSWAERQGHRRHGAASVACLAQGDTGTRPVELLQPRAGVAQAPASAGAVATVDLGPVAIVGDADGEQVIPLPGGDDDAPRTGAPSHP